MKTIKILTLLGGLAIALTAVAFIPKSRTAPAPEKGFAVVELFTSEGCSSCPPADELVAKIQKEDANQPVYILAFHVDYWNRLGWKDVFSDAKYSARQHQYAEWLHLQSVYTPQAVVNGRTEFVGSEEGNLRNAIKTGLQKSPASTLSLSNIKVDGSKISIQYHTENAGENAGLQLALVEKHAVSNVKRGENSGRTLSHVQIVRALQSISLEKNSGTVNIPAPQEFTQQGYELIAFVQNNNNGQIIAATKAQFGENLNAANIH